MVQKNLWYHRKYKLKQKLIQMPRVLEQSSKTNMAMLAMADLLFTAAECLCVSFLHDFKKHLHTFLHKNEI